MRKFQSHKPLRYYTIMLWALGVLTIGYIAVMLYKGEFITQGIGGYLCAIGAIIPMRGVAYTYVSMDEEALYITDKEPNPLSADRTMLESIERVELRKMKWHELGSYAITIKQKESLLIETRTLGRFGDKEAAELTKTLNALSIEVVGGLRNTSVIHKKIKP